MDLTCTSQALQPEVCNIVDLLTLIGNIVELLTQLAKQEQDLSSQIFAENCLRKLFPIHPDFSISLLQIIFKTRNPGDHRNATCLLPI